MTLSDRIGLYTLSFTLGSMIGVFASWLAAI